MGSVLKIGENYYIEFYARGLKYQQKVGPDENAAQRALQAIEDQIANGEAALIVRDVDYDIFFQDFLKNICLEQSFKTIGRYAATIEHFQKFLIRETPSVKRLSEITPRVIELYRSTLVQRPFARIQPGPNVINLTLVLLKDILEYGIKLGFINDNPVIHIRLLLTPLPAWMILLSQQDLEKLLKGAQPPLREVIEFLSLTGLTLPELLRLTWNDIDWPNKYLQIGGGKPREILLQARAFEILQIRKKENANSVFAFSDFSGQPLDERSLQEDLRNVFLQVSIEGKAQFSSLRHYFAQTLMARGVSLVVLCRYLGFSDVARGMIYSPFIVHYWQRDSWPSF